MSGQSEETTDYFELIGVCAENLAKTRTSTYASGEYWFKLLEAEWDRTCAWLREFDQGSYVMSNYNDALHAVRVFAPMLRMVAMAMHTFCVAPHGGGISAEQWAQRLADGLRFKADGIG